MSVFLLNPTSTVTGGSRAHGLPRQLEPDHEGALGPELQAGN